MTGDIESDGKSIVIREIREWEAGGADRDRTGDLLTAGQAGHAALIIPLWHLVWHLFASNNANNADNTKLPYFPVIP